MCFFCGRRHLFILLLLRRRIPVESGCSFGEDFWYKFEARFLFFLCLGVDILGDWA